MTGATKLVARVSGAPGPWLTLQRMASLLTATFCILMPVFASRDAGARQSRPPASPRPSGARPAPADTALALGTYVSSRIDGKRLPVRDLATDDQGVQYLIEFAELVLALVELLVEAAQPPLEQARDGGADEYETHR